MKLFIMQFPPTLHYNHVFLICSEAKFTSGDPSCSYKQEAVSVGTSLAVGCCFDLVMLTSGISKLYHISMRLTCVVSQNDCIHF
jgi:hypothetical protein